MLNKITNRILLGYSIPLIFLIILSAIVYRTSTRTFQLQAQAQRAEQNIRNTDALVDGINRMVAAARGYYIFPEQRANSTRVYNDGRSQAIEKAQQLQTADNPRVRGAANELSQLIEQSDETFQNVFRLVGQNNLPQARTQLLRTRITDLQARRNRIVSELENELAQIQASAGDSQGFLLRLIIVGTLLALILTLIVGLLNSLPLRQQLPKVVNAAEAIADGNLAYSLDDTKDRTEVGQLLNAFQNMIKSLNKLISQAQRSGIQISTSTTQIAAAGKQLEATVNEQFASMNEVNATARQIAMTAGGLVKSMDEVVKTAQETTNAASNSQTNLDKIQSAMQRLAYATNSISSKLKVMDEKANNINTVVTTITKVADQTNLLSLNAAIEAEKAGEYGAGFAVVAREIRRLADQSAVATLEIEQMVKEMQSSVSSGVIEVDKFRNEVKQYVEEVGNVSEQIASFITEVQGLTPQFVTVNRSMDEQYRGAEQISTAIAQLRDASQQTVQSIQETNHALRQLDDATRGLQREISQFKV
ncbi:methyl-accepting chemotaxis protein [Cyanobacteria bacterium FACHB-DQ100]|uniref:methyl-accepting chemotaxis protein n=1 Tax=Leptolyngbya sp. DQ-M1 TaxID=2933920 RepID=UPI0019998D5D|nr:methyl-accepting chemotaxis protein [Cyanobacteria bacterium FACHB-DQ100]